MTATAAGGTHPTGMHSCKILHTLGSAYKEQLTTLFTKLPSSRLYLVPFIWSGKMSVGC